MSRHGYTDDIDDQLQLGRWRGMVKSAIRGKRGQRLLSDLRTALDAMPTKRLVAGVLQTKDGDVCALGCVCAAKGKDYKEHAEDDPEDDPYEGSELNESLAADLDIAQCLVQEIEYENDEGGWKETPEQRWTRMRKWVGRKLGEPA